LGRALVDAASLLTYATTSLFTAPAATYLLFLALLLFGVVLDVLGQTIELLQQAIHLVLAFFAFLINCGDEIVANLRKLLALEDLMHNAGLSLVLGHLQLRYGKTNSFLHLDNKVLLNILHKVISRRLGKGLVQICWLGFWRFLSPLLTLLVWSLGVTKSLGLFHDVS